MPISVTCPSCGKNHQVQDAMAGMQARCNCGHVITVPFAAAAAGPSQTPVAPATPITVFCPSCGQMHNADPQLAGSQAQCPCGSVITIPSGPAGGDDLFAPGTLAGGAAASSASGSIGADDEYNLAPEDNRPPAQQQNAANELLAKQAAAIAEVERNQQAAYEDDDEGGGGIGGIVIFILIFGVGNFILYQTTGFIIIPRR